VGSDRFAFCVQKGFGLDAPARCFTLNPDTAALGTYASPGIFMQAATLDAPPLPRSKARAMVASAAGTMQVCGEAPPCFTLRLRPPVKDAFDEVYGMLPAWAVPGTSRVIVANVKQGAYPKVGPSPATLWLDVYDLIQKRKVSSARAPKDIYALRFIPIGERALLVTCSRDEQGCGMAVVDPTKLSVRPLPIELHPDLPRGSADTMIPLLPVEGGGWAVVDVRGTSVVVLSATGEIVRTIALPSASALSAGPARAGPWSGGRIVIFESGPSAGAVHVVDPRDGSIKTHVPPACADPP
jgi:hypothetical protein